MPVSSTDVTDVVPLPPAAAAPVRPGRDEPAPPEPLTARWLTAAAWLIPLLGTGALGAVGITRPGLGEDELATWGMVTAAWPDLWAVLAHTDASLAPYYLLLRGWAELAGTSDLALRLPSVLFAAGAAGLVAAIGLRLGGRRVGFVAGLLFAALPTMSRYAQEARPYALTVFAAALATLLLLRLLDRPRRLRRYAAYTLAVALLGLAHTVALLLLIAHAIVVWPGRRPRAVLAWLVAALAGALPAGPVLWWGARQGGEQLAWIPATSVDRLAGTPPALFGGALLAGAVVALALAAMSMRPPVRAATAWAVFPAAGLLAVSLLTPLWVPRYLLFVLPAWVLLAAVALRRLTILRGLLAVVVLGLLGVPAQLDARAPGGHGLAARDLDAVLRVHHRPGDAIVFGPHTGGDQRTSRDAVLRYVHPDRRPADRLLVAAPRTGGRLGGLECADRDLPGCFGDPARVWLVRLGSPAEPTSGLGPAKEQLLRGYAVTRTWQVTGFLVAVLARKAER